MNHKQVTVSELVARIPDGARVGVGGSFVRRHPMAIVREMIRQGKRDLALYGWNNSMEVDLLVAAEAVKEVHSAYVGLGPYGHAHNFRRAVENGRIAVFDESETTAIIRFRAAAFGDPIGVSVVPLGVPRLYHGDDTATVTDPFSGLKTAALKPFALDVAIIHAHRADTMGNVQLDARRMMDNETDMLIAKAAQRILVSVEELVPTSLIRATSQRTILPGVLVEAVALAPLGAHPFSCDLRYDQDEAHLRVYQDWAQASQTPAYIARYIGDAETTYLARLPARQLVKIQNRDTRR